MFFAGEYRERGWPGRTRRSRHVVAGELQRRRVAENVRQREQRQTNKTMATSQIFQAG